AALALAGALAGLNGTATPTMPGLPVADTLAGAHATIAMLLALQARERTGRGQWVDVAMADACLPLHLVSMGLFDDVDARPAPGTWHPKGGVWACADGQYLCTTDMEPAYWRRFCDAIGRPQYAPLQQGVAHHPAMHADLTGLLATRPRDEWYAMLCAAQTQAMPVYSAAQALDHPHHRARGRVHDVAVPGQAPVRQLALPFILNDCPPVPPRAAGLPGADGAAIMHALGLNADDQRALAAAGAFSAQRSGGVA
ncbi:MAG: CoA transferase, partial [Sphingopyxis sp.]